jgi:hypothetical protein
MTKLQAVIVAVAVLLIAMFWITGMMQACGRADRELDKHQKDLDDL